MANKLGVVFKGFDKEIAKYTKALGGGIKPIIDKTLKVAPKVINPLIARDIKRYHDTGDTERSMERKNPITWNGTEASIPVGFHIRKGGLPSVFLMYGTARHFPGDKDKKWHSKPKDDLREDIVGPNIEKRIAKEQEEIFYKEIQKAFGG